MQADNAPTTRSRPVYQQVVKSAHSKQHIFICINDMPAEMKSIYLSCGESERQIFTVKSIGELEPIFSQLMSSLPLSTTVYVSGDETFLWQVSEGLTAEGAQQEQIQLFPPQTKERRMFCCHCYHITPNVTHTPSKCGECGRLLVITDHFSRKNSSYFAYQVNAEDPADIPASEELS